MVSFRCSESRLKTFQYHLWQATLEELVLQTERPELESRRDWSCQSLLCGLFDQATRIGGAYISSELNGKVNFNKIFWGIFLNKRGIKIKKD